jgi:hypothetical protein
MWSKQIGVWTLGIALCLLSLCDVVTAQVMSICACMYVYHIYIYIYIYIYIMYVYVCMYVFLSEACT